MIGEGLRVACYELVVARRRAAAPVRGLEGLAGVGEHAGEGGCVLGVVAGHRQRVQAGDGGLVGTEGRLNLGKVTQCRGA